MSVPLCVVVVAVVVFVVVVVVYVYTQFKTYWTNFVQMFTKLAFLKQEFAVFYLKTKLVGVICGRRDEAQTNTLKQVSVFLA